MDICNSLQDFLIKSRVSDNDLDFFNKNLYEYTNDNLRFEVQNKFSELKEEGKGKKKTLQFYTKQMNIIWEIVGSQTFEAYSIMFSDKHVDSEYHNHRLFYRGASNDGYELAPGIYRKGEKDENYYYHELQVRCPNNLSHLKFFNKLTYMQHYGAPTRLLDITSNPLVALYFACNGNFDKDGKVSIFGIKSEDVAYETSDKVQMLSHLQELNKEERRLLLILSYVYLFDEKYPQSIKSKYIYPLIERFYYNIQKENNAFERNIIPLDMLRPIFVQANQDNPRILKQDGAFIMSGLDLHESDSDKKIRKHVIKELRIPSSVKRSILAELETICIHEASLFPELDTVAQYLRNKQTDVI